MEPRIEHGSEKAQKNDYNSEEEIWIPVKLISTVGLSDLNRK